MERPSHNLPRSEEKVEVLFHSLANMVKHALGMNKDFWKEFDTMDLTLDSFHTRVKQVVRESGIPDKHRQKLWCFFSGAERHRLNNQLAYKDILETLKDDVNEHLKQIQLDTHRTFPDNVEFKEGGGVEKLQNVLVAFSWVNPVVGYTQSMNFWCGMLLLHVEEENAFWLTKVVVEEILPPDYYTKHMLGAMTDSNLVMELLDSYLPKLANVLKIYDVRLSLILPRWLLCLFVNVLSDEAALRIFDSFFIEGNKVLIRACLAILKMKEPELLECTSPDQILAILINPVIENEVALFEHMFDRLWLRGLSYARIQEFREREKKRLEAVLSFNEGRYTRRANRIFKVEYHNPNDLTNEIKSHLIEDIMNTNKFEPFRPRSWRTNYKTPVEVIDNYTPKKTRTKIQIKSTNV